MTQLTPEYARGVRLPFTPYARHYAVDEILHNPDMMGDVSVQFKPGRHIDLGDGERQVAILGTIMPLLGRHALVHVAEHLQEFPIKRKD